LHQPVLKCSLLRQVGLNAFCGAMYSATILIALLSFNPIYYCLLKLLCVMLDKYFGADWANAYANTSMLPNRMAIYPPRMVWVLHAINMSMIAPKTHNNPPDRTSKSRNPCFHDSTSFPGF
jgi:hypothetical protein